MWRQAARAEAAVATSASTATLLWDHAAYFESVKRVPLWHRAKRLSFPMTVAAVALNAYGSVRLLSLAGALSRPMLAADGIPAGCSYAMAFTKAYCVEAFDRVTDALAEMMTVPPSLSVYVDDIAISAEGSVTEVVSNMEEAFNILRGGDRGAIGMSD